MTFCLSCIGLGKINFAILGWIAILFVVFMIAYALFGGRNAKKTKFKLTLVRGRVQLFAFLLGLVFFIF
jgi:hypothetical protein